MALFISLFLIFYLWHIMGTTIGYHRLLSHRSFRCPKLIEYFWVLGGYLAFEGSPIWWATIHRAHHRLTDVAGDPHSPLLSGWKYAYFGWVLRPGYEGDVDPASQSKDLIKDPIYRFLEQGGDWQKAHRLAAVFGVGFRVILLLCFGWVTALASLAAGLIVWQIPLLLNVVCHQPKLGYKNFASKDDSVNVWWVALLTCGEGWHNNHHVFPGSARSGIKAHEFDLSWLTLRLLRTLGLAQI